MIAFNTPASRWRLFWLLTVLATASGVLALGVYRGYAYLKVWRADRLQQLAEKLRNENRWSEAYAKAQAAYALVPTHLATHRTLGRLCELLEPASALAYWKEAARLSADDKEDLQGQLRCLLALGDLAAASTLVQQLQECPPPQAETLQLLACYWQAVGDRDRALSSMRAILETADASPQAPLLYHQAALRLGHSEALKEAEALLWDLAENHPSLAPAAIRGLLEQRQHWVRPSSELGPLATRRCYRTREDRLLRRQVEMRLQSRPLESIWADALKEFQATDPAERFLAMRWLFENGAMEPVADWFSTEEILLRQDTFLLYADALLALDRRQELRRLLDRPRLPVEAHIRFYFGARLARLEGQSESAWLYWRQAVDTAGSRSEALWFLVQASEALGWPEATRLSLQHITAIPFARRTAFAMLLNLAQSQGDSSEMLEILQKMRTEYPHDGAVRNDHIYLRLVLSLDREKAWQEAAALCAGEPNRLAYRMTYAFALYQQNALEAAVAIIEATPIDWKLASHRHRFLAALILRHSGQAARASLLLEGLAIDSLLPEEKKLWPD